MAKHPEQFSTPKGLAMYAWVTKADTKYDKDGKFKINVVLSPDEAAPFVELADTKAEEALAQAKKSEKNPVKLKKLKLTADRPYTETEDGNIALKFVMNQKGKAKDGTEFTQKPKLFDAAGKPITGDLALGNGSVVRVSGYPHVYDGKDGIGVSFRLQAVQVIKLVPYGGGSADAFGFEAEEGFSAEDAPAAPAEAEETETDAGEDAGGDDGDF